MKRCIFGFAIVLMLMLGIFLVGCSSADPTSPRSVTPGEGTSTTTVTQKYAIEQLTPELIRIVGLEEEEITSLQKGYGPAFAEALKEIGKNYIIEEIAAINYVRTNSTMAATGYGSYTKELLIKVSRPRN